MDYTNNLTINQTYFKVQPVKAVVLCSVILTGAGNAVSCITSVTATSVRALIVVAGSILVTFIQVFIAAFVNVFMKKETLT